MLFIKPYLAGLIAFLIIDFIWLKYVALGFYKSHIGHLMTDKPNLAIAGLFYLFYVVGVVILAVYPALEKQSWTVALLYGGLLGLVAYGTYDITNLATLKNWPPIVTIVDMIWGTVLTASVATISYFITVALR
ncbi:MAG: DUF2177 family protein [Rhizobiaceae bacterium]|nr:DUF2177 family protein [Rhizobiaceae bacterium]